VVTAVSLEEQQLRVRMGDQDEGEIAYAFDELDKLMHAYAISIHRRLADAAAQSPLHGGDRAKRLVVLVESGCVLWKAVRTMGADTALLRSGGVAKEVVRERSEQSDQILQIPRRLVLRRRACAVPRSIELRNHCVQVSHPIRWHLHDHVNQVRHHRCSLWSGRSSRHPTP
jgi:hypothetical protein